MNAWLKRLTMSFIVTLGFTVGKLPADPPLVPQSQAIDYSPIPPLGAVIYRPDPSGIGRHPHLNAKGYCCAGDPTWFGCGNWKTEALFVFGSCRTFFFDVCVPNPPREREHQPLFQRHRDSQ